MCLSYSTVIDTTPKDHCLNNNNIRTQNGNHYVNPPNICVPNVTPATPIRTKDQHQSNAVTMPAPEDGVLKKIISFTLSQTNNADCATEKVARPSFVPEKLHFSAYEQFKGKFSSDFQPLSMINLKNFLSITFRRRGHNYDFQQWGLFKFMNNHPNRQYSRVEHNCHCKCTKPIINLKSQNNKTITASNG